MTSFLYGVIYMYVYDFTYGPIYMNLCSNFVDLLSMRSCDHVIWNHNAVNNSKLALNHGSNRAI